jgi:hypothetical protein
VKTPIGTLFSEAGAFGPGLASEAEGITAPAVAAPEVPRNCRRFIEEIGFVLVMQALRPNRFYINSTRSNLKPYTAARSSPDVICDMHVVRYGKQQP